MVRCYAIYLWVVAGWAVSVRCDLVVHGFSPIGGHPGDLHKIYLMHGHGVLSRQWTRFSGFHPFPTVQMSQYFRAR
jgi:hypothetical protein